MTRRRGRRRKKLLDDLKDGRGYSHLKEEALDRTMWRNRFGGCFGPVVRQNTEWMNSKGKGHHRTGHEGSKGGVKVLLHPFFKLGVRWRWVVNATPRSLYPLERPGIHFTGGWVSPRAGLDGCGKSRPPPGFDPRTVYTERANPVHLKCVYIWHTITFAEYHVVCIPTCFYVNLIWSTGILR